MTVAASDAIQVAAFCACVILCVFFMSTCVYKNHIDDNVKTIEAMKMGYIQSFDDEERKVWVKKEEK